MSAIDSLGVSLVKLPVLWYGHVDTQNAKSLTAVYKDHHCPQLTLNKMNKTNCPLKI